MNPEQLDQVVSLVFGDTEDAALAVDHVFAVLAATYGAAWGRSLGDSPLSDVKTAWAYQLGQFTHSKTAKRAILWALQNLPDTVPSAMQFRNVCRLAPSPKVLALPEPKADPARLAAELAKLAPLRDKLVTAAPTVDFKAWAKRLVANPEMTTQTTLRMAKDALGVT